MRQNNSLWESFPWIELHVHLRGCMQADFFMKQLNKYGSSITFEERHLDLFEQVDAIQRILTQSTPIYEDVSSLFIPEKLRDFLLSYLFTGYYIRTIDDFHALVGNVVRWFQLQSHTYVEITVSPYDYLRHDISFADLLECLDDYRCNNRPLIHWILDPVRNNGPEKAQALLEALEQASVQPFSGITLGGMEDSYPINVFHSVYKRAQALGLGCSVHSGETGTARDVLQAVELPGLTRIGHGLRALSDVEACLSLIEHEITLEICPSSNVFTGLIDCISNHPILQLQHPGLKYTINTDDPAFFHCSMSDEYRQLETCGLTEEFLIQTQFQALQAAFCSIELKNQLHQQLQAACSSLPGK